MNSAAETCHNNKSDDYLAVIAAANNDEFIGSKLSSLPCQSNKREILSTVVNPFAEAKAQSTMHDVVWFFLYVDPAELSGGGRKYENETE